MIAILTAHGPISFSTYQAWQRRCNGAWPALSMNDLGSTLRGRIARVSYALDLMQRSQICTNLSLADDFPFTDLL